MRALCLLCVIPLMQACRGKEDSEPIDSFIEGCDTVWYIDYDRDGFGSDLYTLVACDPPEGWVDNAADCDDTNPDVLPLSLWYPDRDADGYGAADEPIEACLQPEGTTADARDCDDADPAIHPDAREICNDGLDNDCDGLQPDACVQRVDSAHGVLYGAAENDSFSAGLSPAGDVDGDGQEDYWFGASLGDGLDGAADAGVVYLVPGPLRPGVEGVESRAVARIVGGELDRAASNLAGGLDLDGDGGPDLAIGARRAEAHLGSETGAVTLWFGPMEGDWSSPEADGALFGDTIWDRFGDDTLAAQDLTGDGRADLLVGAPYYDPSSTVRNAGAVYLFPGPFGAGVRIAGEAASLILEGEDAEDLVGRRLAAGDLDGDGVQEVIIGAWVHSDSLAQAGAVYGVGGGTGGLVSLADADVKITGQSAGDNLGRGLAAPGDADGDGYGDLLVGAPGSDAAHTNAGAVYLLSGASLDLAAPIATFLGEANDDNLGSQVCGGGDVDGDGVGDLLLSATSHGSLGEGAVYLFYGPPSGERSAAAADARFDGEAAQDALGETSQMLPDIAGSGDGRYDLLLGALGNDRGGDDAGAVYLFFEVAE